MKTSAIVLAAGIAALLATAPAMAAPSLRITHAAVSVVVQPENRSDIAVDVYRPNAKLPITVSQSGDETVIDGRLTDFLTTCHGDGAGLRALIFNKGDFGVDQFPKILVHVPMNAVIESGGIVHGSVSRSQSLVLNQGGCGDWTVANVAGQLQARASGVGSIHTGTANAADLTLSGSGEIAAGAIATSLVARVSGTGAIHAQTAASADLTLTGSGDIKTGPLTAGLTAVISGAGSLHVASLNGPYSADVSGVGSIDVPAGHATTLTAHVSGSGSVKFGGVADTLEAEVSGVGSVDVARVTGPVDQHVSGVGSVHVGGH